MMEQITLSNGFRIFSEPRPWLKSCAVGLYIGSGSRFETPETLGVSHCIEHMLFKGTDKLSARDIAEVTDDTGGTLNAFTTKEYTCLYARVLTEHVEKIFSVISDMVLYPALREQELETEKGVILEERSSYEDSSEDLCTDAFYESFYPADMLGQNIVGTVETIRNMNAETIRAHMQKFYVPERMVAVFSGAFDREQVIELCEKQFGSLQNTHFPLIYSAPKGAKFIRGIKKNFQQNILMLGLPGVPLEDRRIHAITYACAVLGGAGSSRLFQRLREELGLVYSADAYHSAFLGTGALCITMGLSAGKETKALKETMRLCRTFPETITEAELERAKMQAVAAITMSLESPGSSASRIGRNALLLGKVLSEETLLSDLRNVTLEEVRQAARDYLKPENFSLCVVGKPKTEAQYSALLCAEN